MAERVSPVILADGVGLSRAGPLPSQMTNPSSPLTVPAAGDRPVLFWQPDSDESHVQTSVARAAEFLKVSANEVVSAIDSGELLGGWFVDWEAGGAV